MSVALAANALIDEDEFAAHIGAGTSISVDDARRVINRASDLLGDYLRRNLRLPSADVVEFHTLEPSTVVLHLRDWPAYSVTSVHEDTSRTYGAGYLIAGSGYIVSKPHGRLARVEASGGARAWMTGFRAVRVAYRAGYALADIPQRYKDAAGTLAAILWHEKKRGSFGTTGMSDGQGNFSRLSSSHLPPSIVGPLEGDRAPVRSTGERDE